MGRRTGADQVGCAVYVYTPTYDYFCNTRSVLCNLEYGISISRDSFTFVPNKCVPSPASLPSLRSCTADADIPPADG